MRSSRKMSFIIQLCTVLGKNNNIIYMYNILSVHIIILYIGLSIILFTWVVHSCFLDKICRILYNLNTDWQGCCLGLDRRLHHSRRGCIYLCMGYSYNFLKHSINLKEANNKNNNKPPSLQFPGQSGKLVQVSGRRRRGRRGD